jgi:uncharacterized protein YehS (DUF1456 family)
MPQFAETLTLTVSVSKEEIAAIVREKIAKQFNVTSDEIDIINFRMNSSIIFHKQLDITDRDFEIHPRNFVVTFTKPIVEQKNGSQEQTPTNQLSV